MLLRLRIPPIQRFVVFQHFQKPFRIDDRRVASMSTVLFEIVLDSVEIQTDHESRHVAKMLNHSADP